MLLVLAIHLIFSSRGQSNKPRNSVHAVETSSERPHEEQNDVDLWVTKIPLFGQILIRYQFKK